MKSKYVMIVLLTLIFNLFSCTVQKMINIEENSPNYYKNIYGLVTINNDWVEFVSPAELMAGKIKGVVSGMNGLENVTYLISDVKILWVKKKDLFNSIWDTVSIFGTAVYLYNPLFTLAASGFALIIYTL